MEKDWPTIVGVVDDVRQQGLTSQPDPAIYQPYLQVARAEWLMHLTFVVRTPSGIPANLVSGMRDALREVDRDQQARSTGLPAVPATPAQRGQYVTIYCSGLGKASNSPGSGFVAAASPISNTALTPTSLGNFFGLDGVSAQEPATPQAG